MAINPIEIVKLIHDRRIMHKLGFEMILGEMVIKTLESFVYEQMNFITFNR